MTNPIIIAYHLIWTAYGWWLPNDPRGSTSKKLRNNILAELGSVHHGRKRIQPPSNEIREFYKNAAVKLKHPLLLFGQSETKIIASAFADTISQYRYTCYACAIMPEHVHILIRKHKHNAEQMIAFLQEHSRLRLSETDLQSVNHPVWSGSGWKVFLDHPDSIRRTIRYINNNPIKSNIKPQEWTFVKNYDGWPLHPGHNPNSPYARRLGGKY